MRKMSLTLGLMTILVAGARAEGTPTPIVLDFNKADPKLPEADPTLPEKDRLILAAEFLASHKIGIAAQTGRTNVVIVRPDQSYEGHAIVAGHNVMTQIFENGANREKTAISYTLSLPTLARRIELTRASLYAHTQSGVSHPGWQALAFLEEVKGQVGGGAAAFEDYMVHMAVGNENAEPERTYVLEAPLGGGFRHIKIQSDGRGTAGFSGVLLSGIKIFPKGD